MGKLISTTSLVYNLEIYKKISQNGSRSQKAHEACGGAHSLDARQIGRLLRPSSIIRSSQAARVFASGALPEESSQVRFDVHRSQEDPRPAARQGRRPGPLTTPIQLGSWTSLK